MSDVRGALVFTGLGALTLAAFAASLLIGPAAIGLGETFHALAGGDLGTVGLIVREVRLPRALLGLTIGASLGLAGAALQGYLRNPLAEPGVIGITAAAVFGAVVTFYSGFAALFALALPLGGMAGALAGVVL